MTNRRMLETRRESGGPSLEKPCISGPIEGLAVYSWLCSWRNARFPRTTQKRVKRSHVGNQRKAPPPAWETTVQSPLKTLQTTPGQFKRNRACPLLCRVWVRSLPCAHPDTITHSSTDSLCRPAQDSSQESWNTSSHSVRVTTDGRCSVLRSRTSYTRVSHKANMCAITNTMEVGTFQ